MKILLVDDDSFLRDMYATKFNEAGHKVSTAKNGEDALRMLKEDTYDIILLDMVMPGMSGLELLKAIRSSDLSPKVKCVVLSNQGEEQDIASAKKEGAAGYIVKAESIPSEVLAKVEAICK